MEHSLTEDFWDELYRQKDTGWDLGKISPPLKTFFETLTDRDLRILIPGCGFGHEAEYLHRNGFNKVYLLDISAAPLMAFRSRVPSFPPEHLLKEDFFSHRGTYELIIEQTFFCALHPAQRQDYVIKMHDLLSRGGKISGLLFNDPLNEDKPPFGGNEAEYRALFADKFRIDQMQAAPDSVEQRMGRELFFMATKV